MHPSPEILSCQASWSSQSSAGFECFDTILGLGVGMEAASDRGALSCALCRKEADATDAISLGLPGHVAMGLVLPLNRCPAMYIDVTLVLLG